jgi:hypothetical protein
VVLCRKGNSWIPRARTARGWRTWPSAMIDINDGTGEDDLAR